MLKLKCVLLALAWVAPILGQQLSIHRGSPLAKSVIVSAEVAEEGSFELQRSFGLGTNWIRLINFNSLAATNVFSDSRTNASAFYRLVRLTVPPAITNQPSGATNYVGNEIRLEGAASGSWPLRYQWYKGGELVPGATSNQLVLAGITGNSGNYTLLASNSWGFSLSTAAPVKIINPVATSIAGRKIRYVVRSGQGGAVSSGSFDTTYSALGSYTAISSNALLNDSGYWQYGAATAQPVGRIVMSASFIYPDGTVNDLTFTNETSGTFLLQVPNSSARQSGEFTFLP